MTRLRAQWQRLYVPPSQSGVVHGAQEGCLIDAEGCVKAMVLTVTKPADWAPLSAVWQGVQADLGWPAPAIAISGVDAYQLWFSLQAPVAAAQAHAVLTWLRARYLGALSTTRVGLWPEPAAQAPSQLGGVGGIPGLPTLADQWSAFVAPDLAPVFADTPWLDVPPGEDGQAELLSGLRSVSPAAWLEVCSQMQEQLQGQEQLRVQAQAAPDASLRVCEPFVSSTPGTQDPKRFLQEVMNDPTVPLALRIEAAKALLPHSAA
jgi:hypothetical protein